MPEVVSFDKYKSGGAYHWAECDRRLGNWKRYNPAVDARYRLTVQAVRAVARPQATILDIGCGDGLLLARIAPLMKRVTGVDSEESAIRLAREKLREFSNCRVIHASSYELPSADDSFDVVISADVIEHLKDPSSHLRECCRVLKPDGALVLTTPKWRPDRKWDMRHEKEYRADELRSLLSEYFNEVSLNFFWPIRWSRFYATKLGWRLLKLLAIQLYNPFLRTGSEPRKFGQILATCRQPRR